MHNRNAGFTLLELLVTIIVLTSLLAMGYPSFSSLAQKNKHRTEVRDLYQAMQYARYTAISYNNLVTVCPVDGDQCTNDWSYPIAIFLDPLNQKEITNPENLKKIYPGPRYNQLKPFPATKQYFQFRGTGETKGTPGRIEITLVDDSAITPTSKIILSWSGRPRTVYGSM